MVAVGVRTTALWVEAEYRVPKSRKDRELEPTMASHKTVYSLSLIKLSIMKDFSYKLPNIISRGNHEILT